jgi:hypothetical protein
MKTELIIFLASMLSLASYWLGVGANDQIHKDGQPNAICGPLSIALHLAAVVGVIWSIYTAFSQ